MSGLNRFNWIANCYDTLVNVFFGDTLHRAQINFISEIGSDDHILILGGGSGKFLNDLLANKPRIRVTYIEASSKMIALAKRANTNSTVNFVHGTHENIPDELYDAIITNFFLDLFPDKEVQSLVSLVSRKLRVGGKWFAAEFERTEKFKHRLTLSLMYLCFRITGSLDAKHLPAWRSALNNEGLKLKEQRFFNDGFVSANLFVSR